MLEKPWIDVISNDGIQSFGIEEVLLNAHEITDIFDSTPLMKYGVYRFLVAFVSDALNISDTNSIVAFFQEGKFPSETIEGYCETHGRKFFLFSDADPFYQNIKLKKLKKTNYISSLFHHLPQGRNPIFFHDVFEDEQCISPSLCTRAIITLSPFCIGLGVSHYTSERKRVNAHDRSSTI